MGKARSDLFGQFKTQYEENKRLEIKDINLFHSIHLSENDHTNILWDILRYVQHGKHVFYESFIKNVLEIEKNYPAVENVFLNYKEKDKFKRSGTQYQAIAKDSKNTTKRTENKGLIDLVLNDRANDSVVIIENKVCGASDGDRQLSRYYYSFARYNDEKKLDSENFKESYKNHWEKLERVYQHIFIVYLTKDGSKEPVTDNVNNKTYSISEDLKKDLVNSKNYIPASYLDSDNSTGKSILSWLKEDVLPNIIYNENGYFINSVKLYIEYIESELLGTGRDYNSYEKLWKESSIKDCYEAARAYWEGGNKKEDDETIFNEYQNCALYFAEQKIKKMLPSGWNIHCAGTFLLIYKEEWRKCEERKYTIPTFCIALNNTELRKYLKNPETKLKWQFQIEHISVEGTNQNLSPMQDGVEKILSINPTPTNHSKTNVYVSDDFTYQLTLEGIETLCNRFSTDTDITSAINNVKANNLD